MNKKLRWITETAMMLALLIALQWVGSFVPEEFTKQLVTGSLVNCVLAVTVLMVGLSSGITVALISPVMAFLLNIAPQILVVPAIMVGNTVFVLLLHFIAGKDSKKIFRQIAAWIIAAAAKFATLYGIVAGLICGVFAPSLLAAGSLKQPMLAALTFKFGWPQLVTALIGGAVALLIVPVLRKKKKK